MNALDLLRGLRSKVELDSQINETEVIVTEFSGDYKESKIVILQEIEGITQKIEVIAKIVKNPVFFT